MVFFHVGELPKMILMGINSHSSWVIQPINRKKIDASPTMLISKHLVSPCPKLDGLLFITVILWLVCYLPSGYLT